MQTNSANLDSLFIDHLNHLQQAYAKVLATFGFDQVAIFSGATEYQYSDDQELNFTGFGHFIHWTGAAHNANEWLLISQTAKPIWFYFAPADFWHLTTPAPTGVLSEFFTLEAITEARLPNTISQAKNLAVIGNVAQANLPAGAVVNPPELVNALNELRLCKSAYEAQCLYIANQQALLGHDAAREAFKVGASELDAQLAYLAASRQREAHVPYQNIIGLNQHAGTLHYQHYQVDAPENLYSLLVDAGYRYRGYCADITRTWASTQSHPAFSQLIEGVTDFQQRLIAQITPGLDYIELHKAMHSELAELLIDAEILNCSASEAVDSGLTRAFCPHGLGHSLGIQVHDVAGHLVNTKGEPISKVASDPALRLTRHLQTGMVVTIEPGLYFIDMLLAPFKETHSKAVNWSLIEVLKPHGGIRIEDNIWVTENGSTNLTQGSPIPDVDVE